MGEDVNDILRQTSLEPERVGGVGEFGIAIVKVLGLDQGIGDGMSTIGNSADVIFIFISRRGNITSILEGTGQNIIESGIEIVLNGRRHLHLSERCLVVVIIPHDGGRKHAPTAVTAPCCRDEMGGGRSSAATAAAGAGSRIEGAGSERPNECRRSSGPPPGRSGEVGSRHGQDGHALLTTDESAGIGRSSTTAGICCRRTSSILLLLYLAAVDQRTHSRRFSSRKKIGCEMYRKKGCGFPLLCRRSRK